MTTLTDTQVITASGGLVELGYRQITSQTTVTATSGTPGTTIIPSFSVVCDGSPVLVEFSSPYINVVASSNMRLWLQIDGTNYQMGILSPTGFAPTQLSFRVTPTAGSHTFALIAWADVGGGFVGAGPGLSATDYVPAFLRVSKIVQATQWPAVTTGTIICTSSTRPSAPFEGQTIYETDTDLSLTWSGSAWVQGYSIGAWNTWTPTVTQPSTISLAATTARWTRIGRTVIGNANVTVNGTGMAGNSVLMSLPVPAAAAFPAIGSAWIYDNSAVVRYVCVADLASTTAMNFAHDASAASYWGGAPSIGLGSADQIRVSFTYEAAS